MIKINNIEYPLSPGDRVFDLLARYGLGGFGVCGGKGTCGKCLVSVDGETVLACRTKVRDNMTVVLPDSGEINVLESGSGTSWQVDINKYLPDDLGVACDIGTTTVVCHLLSMATGSRLATVSGANAQAAFGADVISRIQASKDGKLPELNNAIVTQISGYIENLCHKTGKRMTNVKYLTVAGNTVMCHLFAGLPPDSIGSAPFTPLSLFGREYDGASLGLNFSGKVYITPSVSGYVGGDITADILACEMYAGHGTKLLIDVGTNGEMALLKDEKIYCCATAAGPAFEGAGIICGSTAKPGAVSAVTLKNGKISVAAIGDRPPDGICGSGLIDALALMLQLGAVDETGRLLDDDESETPEYLFDTDNERAFDLTGNKTVYITQKDIRQLQLAKAAIAAGIAVLLSESGTELSEIDALLLAGGFGSKLNPKSACYIGLIPKALLNVTKAVGNAAGEGACSALVSASARETLDEIKEKMIYIELSGHKGFTEKFVDEMLFE